MLQHASRSSCLSLITKEHSNKELNRKSVKILISNPEGVYHLRGKSGNFDHLNEISKNNGVGGTGGGKLGVPGARSLREAGEQGGRGKISKGMGAERNGKKNSQYCTIFCNTKSTQRRELLQMGAGTKSAGSGRREVQTHLTSPPPPPNCGLLRLKKLSTYSN